MLNFNTNTINIERTIDICCKYLFTAHLQTVALYVSNTCFMNYLAHVCISEDHY